MSVRMRECMHRQQYGECDEWARACPPAGHLGARSPGCPSRATASTIAQPTLLAVQIWGTCGVAQGPQAPRVVRDIWGGAGYRNSMEGVGPPEAENNWREWRGHLPCVIVSLWDSSQHHPGEIQRQTLPKTVGSHDRLWPTLTESGF